MALVFLAACGGSSTETAIGVVTHVDGDLTSISGFSIMSDDGLLVFETADRFDFYGGPPSHLFDHLRSSEPIEVKYQLTDGRLLAVAAGDAG